MTDFFDDEYADKLGVLEALRAVTPRTPDPDDLPLPNRMQYE